MSEVERGAPGKSQLVLMVAGALIVVLLISNVWVYMTLQTQTSELQTVQDQLQSVQDDLHSVQGQLSSLNATYLSLNATYTAYVATHSHTDAEYAALEDERDAYKAPKLNLLNLQSSDEWSLDAPYLRLYGEVWNVGNETAYDSRLHVTAYQGPIKVVDSWFGKNIGLGTMSGENKKTINAEISYEGVPLTAWNVTVHWTDESRHNAWSVSADWVAES